MALALLTKKIRKSIRISYSKSSALEETIQISLIKCLHFIDVKIKIQRGVSELVMAQGLKHISQVLFPAILS